MVQRILELQQQSQGCKACAQVLRYCKTNSCSTDRLAPKLASADAPAAERVLRDTALMQQALREAADEEGWEVVSTGALRLLYRHEEGSAVHSFKAVTIMDAPTMHILCLAREVELVRTWNHMLLDGSVLAEMSLVEMLVYMAVWVPWPLKQPALIMRAISTDLLEDEGCFLTCVESVDERSLPAGTQLPAAHPSRDTLRILPGSCMKYTPLPPAGPGKQQRTHCVVQLHVDAGMVSVPHLVINFVLRVFSPLVHRMVGRILKKNFANPSDPLPAALRQRTLLYGLAEASIIKHMARQEEQQQREQQGQRQQQQGR